MSDSDANEMSRLKKLEKILRYQKSERGKELAKEYLKTEKGKARRARKGKSENGKARQKRSNKSQKGRARRKSRLCREPRFHHA